jgi:Arc/MetJ family transcription regulator
MRTNIVIDDQLMKETLRATGLMRTLLRLSKQTDIRRLRGKLHWRGDLEAMRSDR